MENKNVKKEKIADFTKDVKRGEKGEERFKQFMMDYIKSNGYTFKDVAHDKEYQAFDIDFLILDKRHKYALEFKTDSYVSTNMFYEELSCIEKHTVGCFSKTRANVILYYFSATEDLYIIYDIKAYRKWYKENAKSFPSSKVKNKRYDGSFYTAYGRLVPLRLFEKEMIKNSFATKVNLSVNKPEDIMEGIKKTIAYDRGECIETSTKTTIKPSFKFNFNKKDNLRYAK